jgi:glucose-1-phosphate cytidylyltransferase
MSYHVVSLQEGTSLVADIHPIDNGEVRVNGGYFIFKKEIFSYLRDKEELVEEPFHRLLGRSS